MIDKPGIYEKLSFADYLALPYMNNSTLRVAVRKGAGSYEISIPHLLDAIQNRKPATKAMRLGIFLHCGKLEPLAMMQRYCVMPAYELDDDNRTQDGKPTTSKNSTYYKGKVAAFEALNRGKEVVPQDWFDRTMRMLQAYAANEKVCELFNEPGPVETSIVWDEPASGVRCKARLDKVCERSGRMPDLKSTADLGRFQWAIMDYGYDQQQAFYQDGWLALTGERLEPWLAVVESDGVHRVRCAPMGERSLQAGRMRYQTILELYAKAKRDNDWRDTNSIDEWNLPEHVLPSDEQTELTKSGRPLITSQ